MKNLTKLNGVKALSKKEQKSINGGTGKCPNGQLGITGCFNGQWLLFCGGEPIVLSNYCR